MPNFSPRSKEKLATCHQDLQRLFNEVIKEHDCAVICGHRDQKTQDEAFRTGHSKVKWPRGKHNKIPSLAADVMPFPIDWKDHRRICDFASEVIQTAKKLGIKIKWGGNFSFFDGAHYELEE